MCGEIVSVGIAQNKLVLGGSYGDIDASGGIRVCAKPTVWAQYMVTLRANTSYETCVAIFTIDENFRVIITVLTESEWRTLKPSFAHDGEYFYIKRQSGVIFGIQPLNSTSWRALKWISGVYPASPTAITPTVRKVSYTT